MEQTQTESQTERPPHHLIIGQNVDLQNIKPIVFPKGFELFHRCHTLFVAQGFTCLLGFERVPAGSTATEEAFAPVTGAVVEEPGNPRLAAAVIHQI